MGSVLTATSRATGRDTVLRAEGVSKVFGARRVLDDVTLDVRAGEIHALLGQNGSGKSTLIKVISGLYRADEGRVDVLGHEAGSAEASDALAFVHQDLGLVPSASVLENFCLGAFVKGFGSRIDWRANRRSADAALATLGVSLDLDQLVGALGATERAFLAIARASHRLQGRGVFVLDEPTAYLPRDGVAALFEVMTNIAGQGIGTIFVTHDIEEALDISDRVSILRDGVLVATSESASVSTAEIVTQITGMETLALAEREELTVGPATGRPALRVSGFATPRVAMDELALRPGEIVGLTGLQGSGYEEVLYAAFGALDGHAEGTIQVGDDQEIPIRRARPGSMMRRGVAFIPADRRSRGSLPGFSAAHNLTVTDLRSFRSPRLRLRKQHELDWAAETMASFDVRPVDPRLDFGLFSGGNQQKMVLAKWLRREPTVLLVHEPTQGVDIAARYSIYDRLHDLARSGLAVAVAVADQDELPLLCDRVVVFRRGRVAGELTGARVSHRELAELCYGSTSEES